MASKVALIITNTKLYGQTLAQAIGFTSYALIVVEPQASLAAVQDASHRYDLIIAENERGENKAFWGVNLIRISKFFNPRTKSILLSKERIEDPNVDEVLRNPANLNLLELKTRELLF